MMKTQQEIKALIDAEESQEKIRNTATRVIRKALRADLRNNTLLQISNCLIDGLALSVSQIEIVMQKAEEFKKPVPIEKLAKVFKALNNNQQRYNTYGQALSI